MRFGGLFHEISERGDISVKANADILNIENDRIEIFQLPGGGTSRLAIKRIDWQSSRFILRIRNLFISQAANSMLRSEERHQLHAGSFTKNIDCLAAFAITTGVVGNQPKPHTGKLFETVSLEHVDPCQHVGGDRGLSAGREPLQDLNEFGVVISSLRSRARHNVCASNRR